ncbi:MAG: Xaa-Pro peptidase family protein [Treponema sp.]|jgi:Xaa-Pro aminopeptidase|nr:Xaa-Pro peptidase family protein [Treponema sp.]
MDRYDYLGRQTLVRDAMRRQGIDVFLLGPSANLQYLAGYQMAADERLLLLVLPAEAPAFVLANKLYEAQVRVIPVDDESLSGFVLWSDGEDPVALLQKEIIRRRLPFATVALEARLPAFFALPLEAAFPESRFQLGTPLTAPLRQRKDPSELALIRRASIEADKALAEVIAQGDFWLGRTEAEFRDELCRLLHRAGVEAQAIVAVGENAAVPHHVTGDTPIQAGKGLLIDFWGSFQGYYTDCSRTFHFGKPGREFEEVHRIVLEAHLAAEAAAHPGNTLGDVDAAARRVIERAGYGEYFTHRTGHSLGIEAHEPPAAAPGEGSPIVPGMVFSIEPGIYLPGRLGVRIENLVAATDGPPEVLHHYPRELIPISAIPC